MVRNLNDFSILVNYIYQYKEQFEVIDTLLDFFIH